MRFLGSKIYYNIGLFENINVCVLFFFLLVMGGDLLCI